ncbi:tubulin--tyrosine ligase-like protein 12 [Anopheles albimanus]|uniref:tubulin--tyrosine ligase-like protein 12 n=1 Tax=Anopheles albimanus TaxID=7167 RepID=UPI001640AFDE|nr:tubulin--tyrosine ligase-like protein 12 [Anopheles albimanus]
MDYEAFVNVHKPQLQSSGVPEHFWPDLYRKLTGQVFDAGLAFSLLAVDYGDEVRSPEDPVWLLQVSKEGGIKADDPTEIYLIDHAWTFRTDNARQLLTAHPELVSRLAVMMGLEQDDTVPPAAYIPRILQDMWRWCNTYSVSADGLSVENRMPIWYVMDEVGSAVLHGDSPNCRIVPFMHIAEGITYSLLFPIEDIDEGDTLYRDFVEGVPSDVKERDALLLPWRYCSFVKEDFSQSEPSKEYFLAGHVEETLPGEDIPPPLIDANRPLKVYSQYEMVNKYLTDPSYELVDEPAEADILWMTSHFKEFRELSESRPNTFVNQFPFENVMTIKDLLSIVCRRVAADGACEEESDSDPLVNPRPRWLPVTYNLKTELVAFASYFQNRTQRGLDNHWIVKPWNLARTLDTHITDNLAQIMRLQQTGPKIAQKYIEHPVLFERTELEAAVKFDVRYVLLVKSVDDLCAYVYTNFFLRFANKPFQLDDFDDYEKHFTVMNYGEFTLRHMKCDEFRRCWATQYPRHDWDAIETDICTMLKEMLQGATKLRPPCGIGANQQSRGLYAVDLMLEWTGDAYTRIQPKLLEVNFTPDCKRACEYYPDFYNDVFNLLFLDQENLDVFRRIC